MNRTYFSYNALISQRASGYKSTAHALAELIDNSFDANASNVRIIFIETITSQDHNKCIHEIITADDGKGMDKDILDGCLQFGNTTNEDVNLMIKNKIKGKYGYGLPNASLSQCPKVEVYSRKGNGKFLKSYLDLGLKTIDRPNIQEVNPPTYYADFKIPLSPKGGTIVSWTQCDRLSHIRPRTIIDQCLKLHGSIYRYLLSSGKKIKYEVYQRNHNGTHTLKDEAEAICNDPMFLMPNAYISRFLYKESQDQKPHAAYYKKFSISDKESKPTNQLLTEHTFPFPFTWRNKVFNFEIKTSCAYVDIQKPGVREGGNTLVGRQYGKKKNISFIRSEREISRGFYDFGKENIETDRWWTIEIHFTPDADELLGVHNNKQDVEFRETDYTAEDDQYDEHRASLQEARTELWVLLTKKIRDAIKKSRQKIKKQAADWEAAHSVSGQKNPLPSGSDRAHGAIEKTDGERKAAFSSEEKGQLYKKLIEKYPDIPKKDIETAIVNFDTRKAKACILYNYSDSEALWTFTPVNDFLIVLINTNHPFYSNVIAPLKLNSSSEALAAIELFIESLAYEENYTFAKEHEQEILQHFRVHVGLHLKRYISDNNIAVENIDDAEKAKVEE